ncbi:MarR family transcriptional regulator [Bradyrhizobium sp. B097]|uniref:MarR family winged helix-turn-helix transcriptional regulator n=1 Tax=Bradyrhizobium sp. B097 TaxID=3140244 RepID=UPI00318312A2
MTKAKEEALPALRLGEWLPYRLSIIAGRVARPLEAFYGERFRLSQGAWRVLAVAADRSGVNASEISRACELDPFAVSRGISQLVDLGFAERSSAKADRRYASVTITSAGKAAFDEIAAMARVIEDDLLGPLAATERRLLSQAIASLEVVSARIEAAGWHALRERINP